MSPDFSNPAINLSPDEPVSAPTSIPAPPAAPLPYAQQNHPASQIELLEPEPLWKRYAYAILVLLIAFAFFKAVTCYWVPAHAGTDQNGYLVGGKLFAQTLTMRQSPLHPGSRDELDPHQYVGNMWIGAGLGTPDERYYPKYPLGLPALYAILIWIAALLPAGWTLWLTYSLSPVAMSFAVLGSYLLAQRFTGSFGALLTAIVFATSPVTTQLAINPNSHAAAVCCVVWGLYFLIGWWQYRGTLRAIAAGFLLGYAATIRYSEGTLIFPLGLVALFALRWRDWKTLRQAITLLAAWALPVGLLVLYNHFAIGDLTGYDPTHESTGFQWGNAADNWETMLRQLNTNGLALLFPLALAGLVWMFWWNWRAASVLAAWIIPCLLIYTFYYWAPDGTTIGYLRFFTTILPGLALCFFWLMSRLNAWAKWHHETDRLTPISIAAAITSGLVVTGLCGFVLERAWLADHSLADAGLQQNWITRHLDPPPPSEDAEFDVPHVAALKLQADWWGALAAGTAASLITLALVRGRVVVPAVGEGLLVGVVVAIHLTNAIPSLQADQFLREQLAIRTDAIREAVPEGSVIFCPEQDLLNHLQFIGEYSLYEGSTFRRDWVQNLPNADQGDTPNPLDFSRRNALYNRLKDLSQDQLDAQARRIIHDALASNRRVFFIIPAKPNQPIPKKVRRAMGGNAKEKNIRVSDLIARICPPDRFTVSIAAVSPSYSPGTLPPRSNKPRGPRQLSPTDNLTPRPPLQIVEITPISS
jgi:4-amino-4-deoxy-L-arabinose transferase-like glycosyltransferase